MCGHCSLLGGLAHAACLGASARNSAPNVCTAVRVFIIINWVLKCITTRYESYGKMGAFVELECARARAVYPARIFQEQDHAIHAWHCHCHWVHVACSARMRSLSQASSSAREAQSAAERTSRRLERACTLTHRLGTLATIQDHSDHPGLPVPYDRV